MEQLTGPENIVLGGLAGIVHTVFVQPILYCKNASQQRLALTMNPRYLYRGFVASSANFALMTGVQFYGAGKVGSIFANKNGKKKLDNKSEKLISSMTGGLLSGCISSPMELVTIQQQRYGWTMIETMYHIATNYSLKNGICRGMISTMCRSSLFTTSYLGITPLMQDKLYDKFIIDNNNNDNNNYNRVMISVISATVVCAFYCIVSHPIDTIKTCMQGDIQQKQYKTISDTYKVLYYNQGGLQRIYKGYWWRYSFTLAGMFVLIRSKEVFAPILFPNQFELELHQNAWY